MLAVDLRLERLHVSDYRNLADVVVELDARFSVLVGHNGAGKTNLLEAIYLVSTLRSFRSTDLGPLIRMGQKSARVDLWARDPTVDLTTRLSVRIDHGERSIRRTPEADGKTVRPATSFYGRVPAILFTPEDLGVLRGSPAGRRQLLDRILFARQRQHIVDVRDYEKLLRSRNRLLRQDPSRDFDRARMLDTYEHGLARIGARIWTRRVDIIATLAQPFADGFGEIHGRRPASVHYDARLGEAPAEIREQVLRERLLSRRHEDELRGTTSTGPHRDDLRIELGGRLAAEIASQGQMRALVLALKLAELRTATAEIGHAPLLLLDDVSSELDPDRTEQLFRVLMEHAGQCLLTTTELRFAAILDRAHRRIFEVDSGRVRSLEPHR